MVYESDFKTLRGQTWRDQSLTLFHMTRTQRQCQPCTWATSSSDVLVLWSSSRATKVQQSLRNWVSSNNHGKTWHGKTTVAIKDLSSRLWITIQASQVFGGVTGPQVAVDLNCWHQNPSWRWNSIPAQQGRFDAAGLPHIPQMIFQNQHESTCSLLVKFIQVTKPWFPAPAEPKNPLIEPWHCFEAHFWCHQGFELAL